MLTLDPDAWMTVTSKNAKTSKQYKHPSNTSTTTSNTSVATSNSDTTPTNILPLVWGHAGTSLTSGTSHTNGTTSNFNGTIFTGPTIKKPTTFTKNYYQQKPKHEQRSFAKPLKQYWNGFDALSGTEMWYIELDDGTLISNKSVEFSRLESRALLEFYPV
jgi:hypothetical protein